MDHRSVALTCSSVVDGRPDRPSRAGRRHRRNVWCEWWSKTVHCSKARGSNSYQTNFPHQLTRSSVRTRRGSHPAPSGRPRGRPRKMTRFKVYTYTLGVYCVLKHPRALNQTVSNGFTDTDSRFHISCNRSLSETAHKRSSAIFDTVPCGCEHDVIDGDITNSIRSISPSHYQRIPQRPQFMKHVRCLGCRAVQRLEELQVISVKHVHRCRGSAASLC